MANVLSDQTQYAGGITYATPAFSIGAFNNAAPNGGYVFDLPLATVAAFNNQAINVLSATNPSRSAAYSAVDKGLQGLNNPGTGFTDFLTGLTNQSFSLANQTQQNIVSASENAQMQANFRAAVGVQQIIQSKKGGCYITTAICEKNGLADDCDELITLRAFRDQYMRQSEQGRKLVDEYYAVAPRIVDELKKLPHGGVQIFDYLEREYLRPAIAAIKDGDTELALNIYTSMVAYAGNAVGVEA